MPDQFQRVEVPPDIARKLREYITYQDAAYRYRKRNPDLDAWLETSGYVLNSLVVIEAPPDDDLNIPDDLKYPHHRPHGPS